MSQEEKPSQQILKGIDELKKMISTESTTVSCPECGSMVDLKLWGKHQLDFHPKIKEVTKEVSKPIHDLDIINCPDCYPKLKPKFIDKLKQEGYQIKSKEELEDEQREREKAKPVWKPF